MKNSKFVGIWKSFVHNALHVNAWLRSKWKNHRARSYARHSGCSWSIVKQRLLAFKYYSLFMASAYYQDWLISFSRALLDDNRARDRVLQQDKSKSISQITTFLTKMQGWLLHANAEKLNPEAKEPRGLFPKAETGARRVTFRDITIQEYENRLRVYSQPEKIFCYFATIKTENDAGKLKVFMTPIDFLRSLRPGLRQPEGLGLNQFRRIDREKIKKLKCSGLPKDSIFYKLRPDGLLTFCDFLYLVMLLTMPEKYFKMGFKLFDQQGNGNLSIRDMNTLLLGITHDERFRNISAVHFYFFGPQLNQKLSLAKFLEFRRQLQHDVLLLEFNLLKKKRKPTDANKPQSNTISEVCFAKILLKCSAMSKTEKTNTLKRINKKYQPVKRGITQDEFMSFFRFVQHLPDIETALSYHYLAGADISRGALKHISHVLVGVPLSAHVIDVIFTVFNTKNSGILGCNGFIEALRHRMLRCKHTSFNLEDMYGSILKCAKKALM